MQRSNGAACREIFLPLRSACAAYKSKNRPAVELISQFNYPNVLIYADPPYVLSTRYEQRAQYRHEMTDEAHEKLLNTLKAHTGSVVLSGYESPLYDDMLRGWYKTEIKTRTQSTAERKEVLWMNFFPSEQMRLL